MKKGQGGGQTPQDSEHTLPVSASKRSSSLLCQWVGEQNPSPCGEFLRIFSGGRRAALNDAVVKDGEKGRMRYDGSSFVSIRFEQPTAHFPQRLRITSDLRSNFQLRVTI